MKYFAKLDLDNKVVSVINVHNNELKDSNGTEHESLGIQFLNQTLGNGVYVQCWKDFSKRKHMAGVGMTYDDTKDAFIPIQTYPAWTLNEDTCIWEPPIAYPDDDKYYMWDEAATNWVEVE
tara:strand:- start:63 stop:425 length:363 start_codon:yes stop_codon:yes gene_type:complete